MATSTCYLDDGSGITIPGEELAARELEIPADLRMKLSLLVPKGATYVRDMLFDEIYERLPKDPQVRINCFIAQIQPRAAVEWHIHNGAVFFVVLQGLITLQYEHGNEAHKTGDVYSEPIGVVHRGTNPHSHVPCVTFGLTATPVDRSPIVNVSAPTWARDDY
ncbi:cupin domain-containing protein [Pendulispora rubella]|uniref:Cupin domain-containing protein n=1 Tax=Pendulispora rubella TaxID=2741070 RepID=A0ABZ2KY37_9BACT